MSRRARRFALLATVILLVSGLAIGGSATTPAPTEPRNETEADTPASHQDPTNVTEAGDSQQIASYLSRQLASRLNASALAVGDEEYAEGRLLLGDDYDVLLEQYAAVAADADTAQTAAQFNLTREQQREIINQAQQLNQTATAYQAAVDNGNDERARALARDLVANASELNASTTSLTQQYSELETQTNLSFATAQESIETNQRRLTQAAGAIATREFTETNLTVQPTQTNFSVATPTTVSGRLTTANGTAVPNATISVAVGTDTVTTQTGVNGTYTASYQPVTAPLNTSTLTATYVPESGDPFLSSTATTPISITGQHIATLSIANTTTSAGFGDPVRVTGQVATPSVANRSLAGLPIVLQIDDQRVATGATALNGSYTLSTTLPETVAAGDHTLRVSLATDGLAVAPATATAPLTVQSTPTELSVVTSDADTDSQNVSIAGTLTTAAGEPLAGRTLQVRLAGAPLETIQTDALGQYETTIDRSRVAAADTHVVTVKFAPSGSNLAPSTVEQTLSLSTTNLRRQLALVGGTLLVVIVGGLLLLRWRFTARWVRLRSLLGGRTDDGQPTPATSTETAAGRSATTDHVEAVTAADTVPLRKRAQTALEAGDADAAVQLAYAAFRHQTRGPVDRSQTHWEVYNQWRATNQPDASAVRQLTTAYEQATFASESVSIETAQTILELLPSLTDASDRSL